MGWHFATHTRPSTPFRWPTTFWSRLDAVYWCVVVWAHFNMYCTIQNNCISAFYLLLIIIHLGAQRSGKRTHTEREKEWEEKKKIVLRTFRVRIALPCNEHWLAQNSWMVVSFHSLDLCCCVHFFPPCCVCCSVSSWFLVTWQNDYENQTSAQYLCMCVCSSSSEWAHSMHRISSVALFMFCQTCNVHRKLVMCSLFTSICGTTDCYFHTFNHFLSRRHFSQFRFFLCANMAMLSVLFF